MSKFSDRMKVTTPKSILQIDSMDMDLRNGLWNGVVMSYMETIGSGWYKSTPGNYQALWVRIWLHVFKGRIDELDEHGQDFVRQVKDYFFNAAWYEVYNFIEFVKDNFENDFNANINEQFVYYCNRVLEKELSAYRFVNGILTPISSSEEIQAVETALQIEDKYLPVKNHLAKALQHLSNKTKPDYKNSVKESICAVESLCCILTGKTNATLGDSLKLLEKNYDLHGSLKRGFENLYGYASDGQGIRHGGGMMEKSNLSQDEAIFMLVTCSAFTNYLVKKIGV